MIRYPVRYAVLPDAAPAQAAGHPCIDRPLAHPAELVWSPEDPWAVDLCFPAVDPRRSPYTWRFARDLLTDGLDRPTGLGDVHIAPAPGYRIEISMDSDYGHSALHFSAVECRRFLEHVTAVWAPVHVDDAQLAAWIAEADA